MRGGGTLARSKWGMYPSQIPMAGGYPNQVPMGDTPTRSQQGGYPQPGMMGVYLSQVQTGVPKIGYPWQGWGTPQPGQDDGGTKGGVPLAGMGYPLAKMGYPPRLGQEGGAKGGVPPALMGYPPWPGQDGERYQRWGPPGRDGVPPGQVRIGGYLRWSTPGRDGVPPWPGQDGGYLRWGTPWQGWGTPNRSG